MKNQKENDFRIPLIGLMLGFFVGFSFPSESSEPLWWWFDTVFQQAVIPYIFFHTILGFLIGLLIYKFKLRLNHN